MLLFRKVWINGREPKDEYWEIAEVWKIWLMTAHQKHWGRRHWSANVNCLVIRKKRINPFSCNLWEEWLIGSWNRGRKIGIRLNKAQKDWKSMPRKYIQFQAVQLKKKKKKNEKSKKVPLIWCNRSQLCVGNNWRELYFCKNFSEVTMVSYWWTWKEKLA